jgi:DnaJ domain
MAWASHYEVLGVARSADRDIIRAAYRVLVKRYHPDTTTGPKDRAAARFCKIQEAYDVLSDARRRDEYDAQLDASAREPQAPQAPHPTQEPPRPTEESPRAPETEPQPHRAAAARKPPPQGGTGAAPRRIVGTLLVIVVVFIAAIEIIGGFGAPQLLSKDWHGILFLILWLGTLIWFARRVSWRRHRNGGDRLIVKVAMPLFMLYIACCYSIYDNKASQPLPPGTVLRFDNKGNLIQIMPGTSPASLATIERDGWRHEWCTEPVPGVNEWLNYNEQATIKCNNQRREWCAYHPAGPWEDNQEPGVAERNNWLRAWCTRHPANR